MGSSLIALAFRLPEGDPDWQKLHAAIDAADVGTLNEAYAAQTYDDFGGFRNAGDGDDPPDEPYVTFKTAEGVELIATEHEADPLRDWFREGTQALEHFYNGHRTQAFMAGPWDDGVRVLFIGGVTGGDDPFEEWDNVVALNDSGLLRSALGWT
jgi:hypothetical protein